MRSNNPYNNTYGSLIDSFQVNHNDKTLRNSPSDHTIQKRVFSTTFEDDEAADSMMNEVVNGSSCSTMMMEFNSNYPQRDETVMMESQEMNCFDLSSLQPRHTGSSFPLTCSNHHDELNGSIMTSLHRPEYTFLDEPMDALIHHHPFNPVSTTTTSTTTTTNSFSSTSFGSNNSSANTLNSFNPLLLMVPSSSVDSSLSSSSTTTTDSSPLFPLNLSFDEAELNVIEKAFFFQPQISSPLIQPQQQQQAPFMNEEEGIMMIGSTSTAAVIHSITDVDVDPQPQQPPFRNDPQQQQQQQNHTQCLYEESPTMIGSQQSVRTTCYNQSSHATTTPQDAHHYNNHSSSQYLQQSLNYNNLQNLNYNNNNNHKQQQQQRTRTSVANPSSHRRRSQSCSSFSSFSNKNPQPTNASLYMNFIPSSSSSLYSQPSSSLTLITSEHSEEPPIMTLNNSNTFTVPSHHHQRTFSSSPNSFSTSPPFMFHSFHPNSGGMNSPSELNTMMNQASLNSPSSSTSSSMNILNGNKINSPSSSSVSASASPTLDNAAVKKKRKSKLFRGHFQSTSTFRKDDKWQFHGQDDSNDLVFYHFLPSSAKQKKKEKNLQQ
ncbi:hypothetical protein C9374_013507 [Naegleria lovaniensis]|uniref:Uncharacterized protein n=1 Tax=Naegleria lovaniensis TaxID=51637 RepID=A0AA88H2E8_NAELO|nr:uncharacterized protein C9374_013507 [Naegleria lovaniensis]KAG2392022.1 hypothetical protein C9374_013507 [Naegleria lovaniensis]